MSLSMTMLTLYDSPARTAVETVLVMRLSLEDVRVKVIKSASSR